MENGDPVRKGEDDIHVVFDDDQRPAGGDPVDHPDRLLRLFPCHSRRGFVEKDQFRIRRKCNADLQSALLPIGKGICRCSHDIGQTDLLCNGFRFCQDLPVSFRPSEKMILESGTGTDT